MQGGCEFYEFEDIFGTDNNISSNVQYERFSYAPEQTTIKESELFLPPLQTQNHELDNFYAENQATVSRNEICNMSFLGSDDRHFQKCGKWTERMLGSLNPSGYSALSDVSEEGKIGQAAFSEKTAPIYSEPGTSLSSGVVSIEEYSKVSGKLPRFECGATFTSEYHLEMYRKIHAKPKQFPEFTAIPSGSGFYSHSSFDNGRNSSSSKDDAIDTGNESSQIASELKLTDRFRMSQYREENIRMKRFVCDTCQNVFPFYSELKRHIRTHTGEKPYACNMCNSSFGQKGHLTRHKAIHAGEKPYECNICLKKFKRKANLSVHLRIHTQEKPYECDVCNSTFSQKSHLTKHKLAHKGA